MRWDTELDELWSAQQAAEPEASHWARARAGYLRRRPTLRQRLRGAWHRGRAWWRAYLAYGTEMHVVRWTCPACGWGGQLAPETFFGFAPPLEHYCAASRRIEWTASPAGRWRI